jgi:hypothetical protein
MNEWFTCLFPHYMSGRCRNNWPLISSRSSTNNVLLGEVLRVFDSKQVKGPRRGTGERSVNILFAGLAPVHRKESWIYF